MAVSNLSLQIVPMIEDEKELYAVVDKVIDHIHSKNVKYEVGPMETTMEGELDDLLKIVSEVQKICEENGADRILTFVKIDYKKDGIEMNEKIGKYRS